MPFSLIPENRTMSAELAETLYNLDTHRVGEHSAGNNAAISHRGDPRDSFALYPARRFRSIPLTLADWL